MLRAGQLLVVSMINISTVSSNDMESDIITAGILIVKLFLLSGGELNTLYKQNIKSATLIIKIVHKDKLVFISPNPLLH
ncbi:hypothetical protein AS034_02085 [[Bacillus] enclensis]|uniref:Uncharacterized protein n=2 Tax=[Bacillus] enclensis TaxID=1402860 RepID=A0A0V8HQ70_9BACI|nr:hypothetical protein AS034_02085 [[Bacillus] enclensis]SCB77668.1 hypothetical protein GA0061094_0433 [[Bacillus] enclensis]